MRGEHLDNTKSLDRQLGSSPHARGTLIVSGSVQAFGGIIPACAGNTLHHHPSTPDNGDHPRMRGEHLGSSV